MHVTVIGIDCATKPQNVGLALGSTGRARPRISRVALGSRDRLVAEVIADWIPKDAPALLALDAPLGWPARLGETLGEHKAGHPVPVQSHLLFERLTDCVVREKLGKRPLEVGADRIARTAHAALDLLQQLREITECPIPLAWSPGFRDHLVAIEVYPAATLVAHSLPSSGYKKRDQRDIREAILEALRGYLELPGDSSLLLNSSDALDAVICVLAALDFLEGRTIQPNDMVRAAKEGWIWVREKD